jgi:hypothetical protein
LMHLKKPHCIDPVLDSLRRSGEFKRKSNPAAFSSLHPPLYTQKNSATPTGHCRVQFCKVSRGVYIF